MIRKLFFALAASLVLSSAVAQHSLLYQVSGKGLQQPSYLYGTIHLICESDFFMPAALDSAFSQAKTLYLELDMDDPEVIGGLMSAMREKKEAYDLGNLFKPNDFMKLEKFFRDSMMQDINAFRKMKPMMALMYILRKAVVCEGPIASYEMTLLKKAQESKKALLGLEGVADQIAIFDALPDSTEARIIMEYINDIEQQQENFRAMVAVYKQQDVDAMHKFIELSPEMAGLEEVMLFSRNRKWIPIIEKAMQKASTLFAFGALHLSGEQGVVELLRKQGYTVTPVR